MSSSVPSPASLPPAGNAPLNSVQPEIGSPPGWERRSLARLLQLDADGDGRFSSCHVDANLNGHVFGGQLIGQALVAAANDIGPGQPVHSLQINFLAPGLLDQPMRYETQPLLQGKRFQVRHVMAVQDGRNVASANVSFHIPEWGPRRQQPMPVDVPMPEGLESMSSIVTRHADRLPRQLAKRAALQRVVEIRPLAPDAMLFRRSDEARMRYWIRAVEPLPEAALLHQAALGYLSDFWFPVTAIAAHVDRKLQTGLHMASLNHTIWFHGPARADDWLLVDAFSNFAEHGRGLSQAQVYTRDGRMVASWAQEGLMRGWQELQGEPVAPGDMPADAAA